MSNTVLIDLLDKEEMTYGASFEFSGGLSDLQAYAVKQAISQSGYKAMSYMDKENVIEDLVIIAMDMFDAWKIEDLSFNLRNKSNFVEFVDALEEELKILALYRNLQMEQ